MRNDIAKDHSLTVPTADLIMIHHSFLYRDGVGGPDYISSFDFSLYVSHGAFATGFKQTTSRSLNVPNIL